MYLTKHTYYDISNSGGDYMDYYSSIKELLINNELTKKVKDYSKNRSDLTTYYEVGKLLSDVGKHYGNNIVKQYSNQLVVDVGKKYNERTLRRMRQFYIFCKSCVQLYDWWSEKCDIIDIAKQNM